MLKILQARLQQYVNWELPDIQVVFSKDRETRDQIANIHWIIEKARFPETIYFCFIAYAKAFDSVDHNKTVENSGRYGNTKPASWEMCMQARKQQIELDMEQQTSSKWERSRSKLYIVTLLI